MKNRLAASKVLSGSNILFLAGALLWLPSLNAAVKAESNRPYYFGRTQDITPVIVTLTDRNELLRFKIPKVYLTFSENWNGGPQDFIVLETIFPSMEPLSATRRSMSGNDVLIIHLNAGDQRRGDQAVSKRLPWYISQKWTQIARLGDDFLLYVEHRDVEKRKDDARIIYEYLVPLADDQQIYFKCLKAMGLAHVGCTGIVNFGQNLLVEFQFKRSQLAKWKHLREATLNLLNQFKEDADQ